MASYQLPPRVIAAIGEYVRSRPQGRPVSVARLTGATRCIAPELAMGDNELSDMIARELMHAGIVIDFDARESRVAYLGDELESRATRSA